MSEDVQVSVRWDNSTVFASESIDCMITFTNSSNARVRRSPSPAPSYNGKHRDRWKQTLPYHERNTARASTYRLAPSFDPSSPSSTQSKTTLINNGVSNYQKNATAATSAPLGPATKRHRRSISIVSIGSDATERSAAPPRQRPGQNHVRAASMQILPRRNGMPSPGPLSAGSHDRAFTLPSPFSGSPGSHPERDSSVQPTTRAGLNRFSTSPVSTKADQNQLAGFRFPLASGTIDEVGLGRIRLGTKLSEPLRRALPLQPAQQASSFEHPNQFTRVLTPGSINGTPRSSGEFFSMSNNSTETLASEYLSQETVRMLPQSVHRRQGSSLGPLRMPRVETLMMGFAQVMGSFTLDGSLVNQSAFDDVKLKGIIGGQGGGGLVRSQSVKRDGSLLGSFGWGNLGETFGGLLSDTGMSSMKEAKKSISTKTIPILSTPQSVLFVDLKLSPGESKSFRFRHPIPRGSPASHRGKAIKIQYNLIIGTQRAAKMGQQNKVQRVEIPFRVLPCISGDGHVLGHDLMSPHTLLSNSSTVTPVKNVQFGSTVAATSRDTSNRSTDSGEFLSYAEKLLVQSKRAENPGLLSPIEDEARSYAGLAGQQLTVKENINAAMVKGSTGSSSKRHVNRFEINRGGQNVAVVMLSRPAYRLGETIPVVIDFRQADIACFSLHTTLESFENVDATIALRSRASIQRVTRKIHASHHESTLFSDRVVFNPTIPASATPEFITSGVSLEWNLRFEFVADRLVKPLMLPFP